MIYQQILENQEAVMLYWEHRDIEDAFTKVKIILSILGASTYSKIKSPNFYLFSFYSFEG